MIVTVLEIIDEYRSPGKSIVLERVKDGADYKITGKPFRLYICKRFRDRESAVKAFLVEAPKPQHHRYPGLDRT